MAVAAVAVALIALAVPGAAAPQGQPGWITVDTTADGNDGECARDCTLREAIALGDQETGRWVQLPPGVYRLTLGPLSLGTDVVFGVDFLGSASSGARATVIDARGVYRAVEVQPGANAVLAGVTVRGGAADVGAGVWVPTATQLFLYNTIVTDNVASGRGGGLATAGGLSVFGSTVSGNRALDAGGGASVEPGGSLYSYASTFSGNEGGAAGGGIASVANLSLTHTTVADNRAASGGGLWWAGEVATTYMVNSLVAANPVGGACGGAVGQRSPWQGNLADDGTCAFASAAEGRVDGNPRLGPLRNNGGPTDTHALAAGSPAINNGSSSACSGVDQRGAQAVRTCDIGAFEYGGRVPEPNVPPPVAGETVNVKRARGIVRVRIPGSSEFFELGSLQQIPVGSTIDTRKGRVTMTAAGRSSAWFYKGLFKFGQTRGKRPLTTLSMTEAIACGKGKAAESAARKKRKRRLWGDGKGRFRTKGRFSAATVLGTKWVVEDRCNGTLTRVVRGKVAVRDFARKRTVVVKAGRRYFAQRR